MPQNAGKHVTESFKFQKYPGQHAPGPPLKGRVGEQHAMLDTEPQFTSAAYSVQIAIRHLVHFLMTTLLMGGLTHMHTLL